MLNLEYRLHLKSHNYWLAGYLNKQSYLKKLMTLFIFNAFKNNEILIY